MAAAEPAYAAAQAGRRIRDNALFSHGLSEARIDAHNHLRLIQRAGRPIERHAKPAMFECRQCRKAFFTGGDGSGDDRIDKNNE